MKKRELIFFMFVVLIMMLCGCERSEDTAFQFHELDDGTYELISVSRKLSGIVTIPSEYKGKPVTSIASSVFGQDSAPSSGITKIIIPDSVQKVKNWAFEISTLEEVYIGANVTEISGYSFAYTPIEKISLSPDNQKFNLKGGCLFQNNDLIIGINDAIIPEETEKICEGAFHSKKLTSATIPDSCHIIEDGAFEGCERLAKIVFPDCLYEIGSNAFSYCSKLEQINFPQSLHSIGKRILYNSGIREVIIPSGIKIVPQGAFMCCWNLEKVTIARGVEEIQSQAFECCFRMKSIEIPDSVTIVEAQSISATVNLEIIIEGSSIPSGWSAYWIDYSPYWLDDPDEEFVPGIVFPRFCH